jgi:hypothetical protein
MTFEPSRARRVPAPLRFAFTVAVSVAATIAASAAFFAAPAPPAAASQAFAWEYHIINGRRTVQTRDTRVLKDGSLADFTQWMQILNEYGAHGWELVTVLGGPGDGSKEYVFKRPR